MRRSWFVAAAAVVMATESPAYAQRAAENVIKTAEDAFGTSIGNETVGLYSTTTARGFSPQQAGNVRLEGLYFDLQMVTMGRLYAGTTMRVGLSAQSYPFPAPTGIADVRFRRPTDHLVGSFGVTVGPYDGVTTDTEVSAPIIPGKLGFVATGSTVNNRFDSQGTYYNYVFGGLLNWTPSDKVDVIAFVQGHMGGGQLAPLIFTSGAFTPPKYDRSVFFGQKWANRSGDPFHFGTITSANIFDDWLLRVGLFRSAYFRAVDYTTFFRNVQSNGVGTLDILRAAPNRDISYSGEARLTRTFTEGPRQHTLHLAVRGRDANHIFGGSGTVSFGAAQIGVEDQKPEPIYPPLSPPNVNHVSQITPGISYVGRWRDVGEFSIGAQKTVFRAKVTPPGTVAPTRTASEPWLYNSTLAVYLGKNAALYGSYTRGLEESGIAPENAINRGEAVPASLTEQVDAGLRYRFMPSVTLIAGVFEVKKPFFDRNAANIFSDVGNLTHRGAEVSVSGQLAPGLTVVAGAMLLRARIEADAAVASFIGAVPVGRPNRTVRLNVQYGPTSWKGFSVDGQINQDGPAYANRANTFQLGANTTLDLGARYVFKVFGTSASARLRVQNVTDQYGWTVASSGSYAPTAPRRFSVQLVADF